MRSKIIYGHINSIASTVIRDVHKHRGTKARVKKYEELSANGATFVTYCFMNNFEILEVVRWVNIYV